MKKKNRTKHLTGSKLMEREKSCTGFIRGVFFGEIMNNDIEQLEVHAELLQL